MESSGSQHARGASLPAGEEHQRSGRGGVRRRGGFMRVRAGLLSMLVALTGAAVFMVLGAAPAAAAESALFGAPSASSFSGVSPAAAGSAIEFGEHGTEAGQFLQPAGVAVDPATGDVYVADAIGARIDEFSASGAFVRAWGWGVRDGAQELQVCTTASGCREGLQGGGAGEFAGGGHGPDGIAFDAGAGAEGELFVLDGGNNRVQAFTPEGSFVLMLGGEVNKGSAKPNVCLAAESAECQAGVEGAAAGEFTKLSKSSEGAIAAGPGGNVYVGDRERVQWFEPGGAPAGEFAVEEGTEAQVRSLAVGTSHVYVTTVSGFTSVVAKVLDYSSTGTAEGTIALAAKPEHAWLAESASGDLFVQETVAKFGTTQQILVFNGKDEETRAFPPPDGGAGETGSGLALVESAGSVTELVAAMHGSGPASVHREAIPPPGPVVYSQSGAPELGAKATLSATINPEGESTQYHFEYGVEGQAKTATAPATLFGKAFATATATAHLSKLLANVSYCFHVVATNGEGTVEGPEECFTALPPVAVDSLSVSEVTASSALLEAELNPSGADTTYHFIYEADGVKKETAAVDIGSGTVDVPVSVHLQGLSASSAYSYTVSAKNEYGTETATATFLTQAAPAQLSLLDGRMWEQVSPVAKHGAALTTIPQEGGLIQSTPDGQALTYLTIHATEAQPQGEPAIELAQIMGRHAAGGWTSKDIATPHEESWGPETGHSAEYRVFSEDLSRSLIEPLGLTPLSQLTTERSPYLRSEAACAVSEASSGECYTPLLTSAEGHADVPTGVEFGASSEPLHFGAAWVAGGNRSLSTVIIKSAVGLIEGVGPGNLYAWRDGSLSLVSALPGDMPLSACAAALGAASPHESTGTGEDSRNAVSPDGSQVIWSDDGCEGHLYLRLLDEEKTVRIDEVQGGTGAGSAEAVYQDAIFEGGRIARVLFADTQQLTAGATGALSQPDLYEYDVATGKLTDITLPVNGGEHANVQGVIPGVGEGGGTTYAYVVAKGVLSEGPNERGEAATAGKHNLYVLQQTGGVWRARFVGSLSGEDGTDWGETPALSPLLGYLTARVSPDGRWLAFMSDEPLTGYDNRAVGSGVPVEEAFLYSAASGRLVCASCDPTGARPTGVVDNGLRLVDQQKVWTARSMGAYLPSWETLGDSGQLGTYQPRYLSNGGRLFFDSPEALVAQDVNGTMDVYEYEPAAGGGESPMSDSCTAASATYHASEGGCVDLISSGASQHESALLDASENGGSVFFLTASKLAASDVDTSYDVYDAHVCGAGWQCPAVEAAASACESARACKGVGGGAAIATAPASATFSGAGNLTPAHSRTSTSSKKGSGKNGKARAKSRRRKLRHALKRCRKRFAHNRHRRRICKRHARRRFGKAARASGHHRRHGHRRRRGKHHHHGHRHRHGR